MELLSPCGNYESLIGVINAGADAVYLAGNKYGARAYADNFSDEEIIKAIKYAHLMNVKVYLTVNTLIKEKEFNDVISYISKFYDEGLDACIVQDIGLISVFNSYFPNMECHISTQAYSCSVNSVNLFKEMGATRVVLARELSLDEIKIIKSECDIEIESFIHGAMCYSYSGQCLFSSCLGGRSGNRGRCAGPCRLNYEANGQSGYLLSMKDQCTLEILPSLIEAGIDSFKIEGRMKKPEYAAFVTAMYRKYINLYLSNPSGYKVSAQDLKSLNSFYMRSEIGTGYYNIRNGSSMLCIDNPAYAGTDESLMNSTHELYLTNIKRIPIDIYADAVEGEFLSISFVYDSFCVTYTGNVVQSSQNRPITEQDIAKQLSKLGDTSFSADNLFISITGNCFIPVKELNEARRDLSAKLEAEILKEKKNNNTYTNSSSVLRSNIVKFLPIISVTTLEQLKTVVSVNYCPVYLVIDDELYNKEKQFISNLDKSIYSIILNLPVVVRNSNIYLLNEYNKEDIVAGYMCHNLEEIYGLYDSCKIIIAGPGLYCWNKKSLDFVNSVSDIFINSYELSQYEIKDLDSERGYTLVYGKLPLMQTANCIEKTTNGCNKGKGDCFSVIKDRKNMTFPVHRNCNSCFNTIYNGVPTSLHGLETKESLHNRIYISFTDENAEDVKAVLEYFLQNKADFKPLNFTRGYYKRGVE